MVLDIPNTSMKRIFTVLALLAGVAGLSAQCTTTNATGCVCATQGQTNCDLLPDLQASWKGLLDSDEYPQTGAGTNYNGQGPDDGRLRISVSSPNVGYGSFTVRGSNWYVCGTDTFQSTSAPGNCPDGTPPRNLITQRIYHKNGNTMTYTDRWSGSMTYHPTHGHNHVDDWSYYTLRIKDPQEPDPRKWPLVGRGSKMGFCLMDYYACSNNNANGHCRTDNTVYNQGTALNSNSNFPNYGLGGGQYNCSPVEQGISSGWTDVYYKNLDMMWINIPPNVCNGDYWIVVEVDPRNYFLETNEDNNWTAIPITLTQQSAPGTGAFASITSDKPANICTGDSILLSCNAGSEMIWSTGDTTQSIYVKDAGDYTVTVTNYCGTATSQVFSVTVGQAGSAPVVEGQTLCAPGSATLPGDPTFEWYDDENATNLVGTGTLTTPFLNGTTTYYVRDVTPLPNSTYFTEPHSEDFGGNGLSTSDQYLIFDAVSPFTLKSVLVNAGSAGQRKVYLRDYAGVALDSVIVTLPAGPSRITLNFNVPSGNDYRLAIGSTRNLYRNSAGVNYPYQIPGILSIKNSSAGNQYYYWYYDWEVEAQGNTCITPLAPVTVTVGTGTIPTISGLGTTYENIDAPVTLVGTPAGGTFSGPGVSGNTFDPALAGVGGPYTITYTYTVDGCTTTATSTVSVTLATSVNDITDLKAPIQVYPNPSNGTFTLTFETKKQHSMRLNVTDLTGRVIWSEDVLSFTGKYSRNFSNGGLAPGVYMLNVIIDGKTSTRKLVIN